MRIPRILGLLLPLFAIGVEGCAPCNDIGCDGGFEWNAELADGGALEPGAYSVEVTLEGMRFAIDCTVADTTADSDCTEPALVDGSGDFSLSFDLSQSGNDWNPEAPPDGFRLDAVDVSGSEPDGSYSETRGPEEVRVVVLRDGEPFVDVEYEVTYVRDDDYRGDERCGYCDERQTREHELAG